MRRQVAVSWVLLVFAGCPTNTPIPGNETIGTFAFVASPVAENGASCPLSDVPDGGFQFQATLSRNRDGGEAWVTINNVSNQGTFDGQVLTATYSAERIFANCGQCKTRLTERFTVALLSQSQNGAASGRCPDDALDGGVPAPDNDAGITRPDSTATGFDAVRACGELVDTTSADPVPTADTDVDGGCVLACNTCALHYVLVGERR